jgi:Sec-independent protein translocase protein TatA
MVAGMAIDAHGYVKALTAAGVPAAQAEAHVEALRDKVLPELATKQDLRELGSGLRKELSEFRSELRTEMSELKSELRTDMGEIKSELRAEMTELKSELRGETAGIRTDMWKMSFAVVLATATLVTFLQKLLA